MFKISKLFTRQQAKSYRYIFDLFNPPDKVRTVIFEFLFTKEDLNDEVHAKNPKSTANYRERILKKKEKKGTKSAYAAIKRAFRH